MNTPFFSSSWAIRCKQLKIKGKIMTKIKSQKDWLKKYKNGKFNNLIENICLNNNLPIDLIENIHCQENALFKVGNKLIKIYSPLVLSKEKQLAELKSYKRANLLNLPTPQILAEGEV